MHTKLIVVFALVCTVVCRDVSIGRSLGGRKIFDEIRQANPAIWRQIENVTIIAPGDEVISGVVVTDRRPEKDGDADIVDGGEGQNSVTIELKSPTVLRGYEFQIEVYTVPSTKYTDGEENLPTPVEANNNQDLPENNESTLSEKNGSGDSEVSENQDTVTTEALETPEKESPTLIGKESNDNIRQARKTEDDEVSKSIEADDMLDAVPPVVTSEAPTTEIPENDKITTETETKTTLQEEVTSVPVTFDNNKNIPDYPALDILDMIKAKESSRNTRNTAVKEPTTQAPTDAPTESEPKTTELDDSYQISDAATDAPSNSNNDDVIDLMPPELGAPFNTDFSDDSKPDPSNTRAGRGLSVIDVANDVTTETASDEKSENITTEAPADEQPRNVRHTDEDVPVEPQNEMPSCNSDLGNKNGMTNVILVNGESLMSDGPKLRFELPIVFIMAEGKLPTIKIIVENPEEKPDLAVPVPVAVPEEPVAVPEELAAVPELPLDGNTEYEDKNLNDYNPSDYDLSKPAN